MKQTNRLKKPERNKQSKRNTQIRRGKQLSLEKETTVREMPKIRTIKPEFFIHEGLFDAEFDYRLPLRVAFMGLITCCDRLGRFRWQPRRLKLHTVPYDPVDMNQVLDALVERGFIVKYNYESEWYGFIPSFLSHQKVSQHEAESILPKPESSHAFQIKTPSVNLGVNDHQPGRETHSVSQFVDPLRKISVQKHEDQDEMDERFRLKNEISDLNFHKTSARRSSSKTSDTLFYTEPMNQLSEEFNENNGLQADFEATNKVNFAGKFNKISARKHQNQDEKSEQLVLKNEILDPRYQKLSTEISLLEISFVCELGDLLSEKTDQESEKAEDFGLKNGALELYFYETAVEPKTDASFCRDPLHLAPEKHSKNNEMSIDLGVANKTHSLDQLLDRLNKISARKHENQSEKSEQLVLKNEILDHRYQKLSTENSSLENEIFLQQSENQDQKDTDLEVKIRPFDKHFGEPSTEPLFLHQSDPLFQAASISSLPEKFNKNNEVPINSRLIKPNCVDEKNFISAHTQGKEGKGMEWKGIERKGIEENGIEGDRIERKRREGKALVVAPEARPCSASNPIQQIFEHWKTVMRHPNAKLDPKRRKLIAKALKFGYEAKQLCQAIEGCSFTPHNMGDNEQHQRYDGLHVILRDADQIDRFMRNYQAPPHRLTEAERRTVSNMQVVQEWIREKQQEGWHNASL